MKKIKLAILIIVIISSLFILSGCSSENANYEKWQEEQNRIEQIQSECNHEWVITSKYDFIFSQYKTISKCSKCGKEMN